MSDGYQGRSAETDFVNQPRRIAIISNRKQLGGDG